MRDPAVTLTNVIENRGTDWKAQQHTYVSEMKGRQARSRRCPGEDDGLAFKPTNLGLSWWSCGFELQAPSWCRELLVQSHWETMPHDRAQVATNLIGFSADQVSRHPEEARSSKQSQLINRRYSWDHTPSPGSAYFRGGRHPCACSLLTMLLQRKHRTPCLHGGCSPACQFSGQLVWHVNGLTMSQVCGPGRLGRSLQWEWALDFLRGTFCAKLSG